MADQYLYQKKRKEFGRHAQFEDIKKNVGHIQPDTQKKQQYQLRDPNRLVLDNLPQLSQHSVNTERVAVNHRGMKHVVGGWPKDLDYTEQGDVAKYLKKLYRDQSLGFLQASKDLVTHTKNCIRQNNVIDLFEEYFYNEPPDLLSETISTKTLMIFKDPNQIKRAITKISWHPDVSTDLRVGVSYAMLRFQQMPPKMPTNSYIWHLNNPNFPEKTLCPPSPLCTMVFNHKNSDIVVGGSYNGSLSFFDLRKGTSSGVIKPFETTLLEKSHHDPVYDIYWLTVGKQGTECVTTSTDGRMLWWDFKKLSEGPIDELQITENFNVGDQQVQKVLGGTSLEYNQDAGPLKYLVGTEQGYIFQANKRKQIEITQRFGIEMGKHHGPVYALQRNPGWSKYFLSVGDWSAKIWSEDNKSPIMQTRYHNSYLTYGCWSPTRTGLFFLTRMDGFVDIWDFFYRQNEVAYSQKVSDSPLTTISVMQSMAAIGDTDGTVSIMSLCRSLYDQTLQPKEKELMQGIFDRESRRERNLENARKQAEIKKPQKKDNTVNEKKLQQQAQQLVDLEENFLKFVGADLDEFEKAKQDQQQQEPVQQQMQQQEEEKKEEEQKSVVPEPEQQQPPAKQELTLEVGTHKFALNAKTAAGPKDMQLTITVQEGGFLSSDYSQSSVQINGIVQQEKLTAKLQFQEDPGREVQLDGDLKSNSLIQGNYSLQQQAVPQVQGGGELNIQISQVKVLLENVEAETLKPFISVSTGGAAVRTVEGAGKEPVFDDAMNLKVGSLDDDFLMEIFDSAAPGDALGSFKTKANELCMNGGIQDVTFTLKAGETDACTFVLSTGYSAAEAAGYSSGWDQTGQFELTKL